MKKTTFQTAVLLVLAIFLGGNLFWACSKDKIFKDVNIYIRADVLLNPLTIEIVDANAANSAIPYDKVKVEVIGPAAGKIYSVVGEKKLKLDGPYLNLGVRRIDEPSLAKPLYFGIRLTSPDYAESLRWYSITNGEEFRVARQSMVKLDAPPAGVTVKEMTFPVTAAAGTAAAVTIETALSAGDVPQKALFTIPAGTQVFSYENPTDALEGNVRVTLVHYSESALDNFPTGAISPYILESNGKPRKPGSSSPAAYTNMNMTVGGVSVGTFSQPIQAAIVLSGEEDNFETGQNVAVGDSISIWSLTEPAMNWQKESRVALVEVNGELWCPWEMQHLSWWEAGSFPPMKTIEQGYQDLGSGNWIPPADPTTLTVQSEIPADSPCGTGGGYFFTEVRSTALRSQLFFSDYLQFYNGRVINLGALLGGIPEGGVVLRIYSGNSCSPGQLFYQSPLITGGGNQVLDIGSALPNDGLNVNIFMEGTCGEGSVIIPTAPIYFRESITGGCFRELGVLRIGQGCSGNLYKGKKYDFAVYYGGLERVVDGITIPVQDSTFLLQDIGGSGHNDTLIIQYSGPNGNILNLNYRNVKIPDDLCEEFKKYFF